MYAEILKASLYPLVAVSLNTASTPPQPPPAKDKIYKATLFERAVHTWVSLLRTVWWAIGLCPLVVLGASLVEDATVTRIAEVLCPVPSTHGAELTPSFVIGCALAVGGSYLRIWCFKTLARYFTFEVAIQNDHKLVTTGPYAFVRHPSYTAAFIAFAGVLLMNCGRGGYVADCGLMSTPVKWVVYASSALFLYTLVAICKRTYVEDAMLRESFGEEWLQYRQRVPYRLFPGIL